MSKRRSTGPGGGAKRARSEDKYREIVEGVLDLRVGGHKVVELFTEIPPAELYPDYREIVAVPISMAEISKRARISAYDNDDDFIADFDQMMENAKLYNGEESPVVEDALLILDYVLDHLGRPVSETTRQKQQLKIIQELVTYKYKGRRLSDVFMVEPDPKEYPSYYEVVKNATSFTTVENQIKEVPAESWKAFLDLVDLIFQNAMTFNQEGSQIYSDAKSLQRQLQSKVAKHTAPSAPSSRQSTPLPSVKLKLRVASGESEDDDDDDDDEEEEEEEEEETVEHRFDDDDDDDFEADSDDLDEEDAGEDGVDDDEDMSGAVGMMPPQAQIIVRDEITHRETGKTARDGMIQLATLTSQPPPPNLQALQGQYGQPKTKLAVPPPYATDMVQVRVPASRNRVLTAFSHTLPPYNHTMTLTVYLHEQLKTVPHSLTVILNGRKLMPINAAMVNNVPVLREEFEIRLSPGLNQVTIAAIGPDPAGSVRPFGPTPVVGAANDEERMVFWLNLTR